MGLLDGAQRYARSLSEILGRMERQARLAGRTETVANLHWLKETVEEELTLLIGVEAQWEDMGGRFELLGVDRQSGEASFLLGKTEFGMPNEDRLWSDGGELSIAGRKLQTNKDAVSICFNSLSAP